MVSIVQPKVYLSCQEFICILIFECNLQFDEDSKISNTHYKITKMHHKIIKKSYILQAIFVVSQHEASQQPSNQGIKKIWKTERGETCCICYR